MEKKLEHIINNYLYEDIKEIQKSESLRRLGLDSMASIELLISIETEFDIQIPDSYLVPGTFENFEKLKETIESILLS
ncbi:acyl carrier protein [Enterococcus sp. AZ020]